MVNRRFVAVAFAGAIVAGLVAGCSSAGPSAGASNAPVTITLWHNYGTESNATATQNLVKAYEALHTNVTINVVSQPANNYFDLLTAAAISKTGPCLATQ
jgi:raffinose/stachyose/melibiose transport system substrate-binding protein